MRQVLPLTAEGTPNLSIPPREVPLTTVQLTSESVLLVRTNSSGAPLGYPELWETEAKALQRAGEWRAQDPKAFMDGHELALYSCRPLRRA